MKKKREAITFLCGMVFTELMGFVVPAAADCLGDWVFKVPEDGVVALQGDSLLYSQDMTATGTHPGANGSAFRRSSFPLAESLEDSFKHRVSVQNRAFPGDRTTEGKKRWGSNVAADLTIIMYGTNDFKNYGRYPDGPLSVAEYRMNIRSILEDLRKKGGAVVLLLPPITNAALEGLKSYRDVARQVAKEDDVPTGDLQNCIGASANYTVDGTHFAPAFNEILAEALERHIVIVAKEGSDEGLK